LAFSVVLISIFTRVFDFSLEPLSYNGLSITRPFCGLHSWYFANRAWAGRSHVKYGLGYTRGYHTSVVGDPPPANPQHYVSHPPLETLITAFGMLLFGTKEWEIRSFDLLLSVPALLLIMLILRKLYNSPVALVCGLLLVSFPIFAYFNFGLLIMLSSLWALYRYLTLTGRLADAPKPKTQHLFELALALFLVIQLGWAGVFPAFVIGLHYCASCLIRRRIQWRVLAVLALAPLTSLALNFYVMINGFLANMNPEGAARSGGWFGSGRLSAAWGLVKTLYQWRASEGERGTFEWIAWLSRNKEYALTNFTTPVLIILSGYLLYLVVAHVVVLIQKASGDPASKSRRIPRSFGYVWFFLLPGIFFLLAFKGLLWVHQYWQSPLMGFVAVGTTLGLFLIGDIVGKIDRRLGKGAIAVVLVVIVGFCNQGLASYRAMRWQSPRTIELFKKLNRQIPPDKGLLTFKDFMIQQSKAKASFYRPEYAWYLDREMVVVNAWRYDLRSARSAEIDDLVGKTVRQIRMQTETGRFPYYFIPARERSEHDPRHRRASEYDTDVTELDALELDRMLKDQNRGDDVTLYFEKCRRYREALINKLKELYSYEYYDNSATPGSEDYCYSGNTPCYIFDLNCPRK